MPKLSPLFLTAGLALAGAGFAQEQQSQHFVTFVQPCGSGGDITLPAGQRPPTSSVIQNGKLELNMGDWGISYDAKNTRYDIGHMRMCLSSEFQYRKGFEDMIQLVKDFCGGNVDVPFDRRRSERNKTQGDVTAFCAGL